MDQTQAVLEKADAAQAQIDNLLLERDETLSRQAALEQAALAATQAVEQARNDIVARDEQELAQARAHQQAVDTLQRQLASAQASLSAANLRVQLADKSAADTQLQLAQALPAHAAQLTRAAEQHAHALAAAQAEHGRTLLQLSLEAKQQRMAAQAELAVLQARQVGDKTAADAELAHAAKALATAVRERDQARVDAVATRELLLHKSTENAQHVQAAADRSAAAVQRAQDQASAALRDHAASERAHAERLASLQDQAARTAEQNRAVLTAQLQRAQELEHARAEAVTAGTRLADTLRDALDQLRGDTAAQLQALQETLQRHRLDHSRLAADRDAVTRALAERTQTHLLAVQQHQGEQQRQREHAHGLQTQLFQATQQLQALRDKADEDAAALQHLAEAARLQQEHGLAAAAGWAQQHERAEAATTGLRQELQASRQRLGAAVQRLQSWNAYAAAVQQRETVGPVSFWQRLRHALREPAQACPQPPPAWHDSAMDADASSPLAADADAGSAAPATPSSPPDMPLPPQRSPMQHIGQLLAQHGSDFVVSAYRNLLGRDPEPEGHTAFEARLLSEHDKVQIIRDLAESDEGRRFNAQLAGLSELIASNRPAPHPVRRLLNKIWRTELASVRTEWTLAAMGHTTDQALRQIAGRLEAVAQVQQTQLQRIDMLLDELHAQARSMADVAQNIHQSQQSLQATVVQHQTSVAQSFIDMSEQIVAVRVAATAPAAMPETPEAAEALSARLQGGQGARRLFDSLQEQLRSSAQAHALATRRSL